MAASHEHLGGANYLQWVRLSLAMGVVALREAACRRLFTRPEWIVDMREVVKSVPNCYVLNTVIPSHQDRPDDGNRPELTMHCFAQPSVVRNVRLFRLEKK